jgi:voltage-gated potassium channel Kch
MGADDRSFQWSPGLVPVHRTRVHPDRGVADPSGHGLCLVLLIHRLKWNPHTSIQEKHMKAITKLATLALSVAGIVGGAALAQTTLDPARKDNPATANYSITPGSNLKRDGSLEGPKTGVVVPASTMDTSTTTTTTATTTEVTPAAPVAVVTTTEAPAPAPVINTMPPARADRN